MIKNNTGYEVVEKVKALSERTTCRNVCSQYLKVQKKCSYLRVYSFQMGKFETFITT